MRSILPSCWVENSETLTNATKATPRAAMIETRFNYAEDGRSYNNMKTQSLVDLIHFLKYQMSEAAIND